MTATDGWSVAAATALGGRHVQLGLPNQDAHGSRRVTHDGEEVLVMAVADGHGGARYVRSDTGSSLAVQVAIEVAADAVAGGLLGHSIARRQRMAQTDLAPRIVEIWRERCIQHLGEHPFTFEEATRADTDLEDDPILAYGSTLILAILSADRLLLTQLGDGDCLIATADGTTSGPIPGDDRLTGGETTSLCLPDAGGDFRVAALDDSTVELVLLASDGYGVAFAADDWRDVVTADMLRQFRQRGTGYVENALPGWLADSARVGGDDVTVMVAHRALPVRAVATAPRSWTRSLARSFALLVTGLAVGATLGWLAATELGTDEGPEAAVTTSSSTTTSVATTTSEPNDPTTLTTAIGEVAGSSDLTPLWLVSDGGAIIEFIPDPTNPLPELTTVEFEVWPTRGALAWGSYWAVEGGTLHEDGDEVELELDAVSGLDAITFANDHLWILSAGGEWLLSVDKDLGCTAHPMRNEFDGAEQGPSGVHQECVFGPGEGSR